MGRGFVRNIGAVCAVVIALSACGGGGASLSALPATNLVGPAPVATATAPPLTPQERTKIVVTIDGSADTATAAIARHAASAAGSRTPMYISPSTLGIATNVNVTGGGALVASSVTDVSVGSPNCVGTNPRTCTILVAAPAGTYDFTMNTYNQAPIGGAIPAAAAVLGKSLVTQAIVPNVANTINFYISGVIAGVANTGGVTFGSLPADGSAHTFGVTLIATDANGNTITAGSSDPYSNPVSISLAESGGSGHAHLVVNGANVGASGTLSHSSDTLSVYYDGAGLAGYSTVTTYSAAGVTAGTVRVSPLYVSGSPYQGANSLTFTATGQTASMTASEAGAPGNLAISQSLTSCGSNATSSGGGAGGSVAVSVTAVVAPASSGGCTAKISDNYGSTINLAVTLPTPASHCSSAAANTQLDNNTISNGSHCTFSTTLASVTVYNPSDGSHPGSANITLSEPYDQKTITESDNCSGKATVSPTSIAGAGSPTGTASGVVTITGQTGSTSCSATFSDGSGGSIVVPITIDPGGTLATPISGTATVTFTGAAFPATPNEPMQIVNFPVTVAPTSSANQIKVSISQIHVNNLTDNAPGDGTANYSPEAVVFDAGSMYATGAQPVTGIMSAQYYLPSNCWLTGCNTGAVQSWAWYSGTTAPANTGYGANQYGVSYSLNGAIGGVGTYQIGFYGQDSCFCTMSGSYTFTYTISQGP
jgi:hypothetical protein